MTSAASPLIPRRAFEGPAEVPSFVAEETLYGALAAGRPVGERGSLVVRGVRCPTTTLGRGRPVLCVHGLGHDQWDFTGLFRARAERCEMTALDLPGFGFADKPGDVDLALLVEAVLAAARASAAPPVVVASSLGGHVALLAALEERRAFAGLLLLAPGGLEPAAPPVAAMARAYYSVAAIAARSDEEIVHNARRIFVDERAALREPLAARKLALHRSPLREVFARPFAAVVDDVFRHPVAARLADLEVPAHLVFGSGDVVVPPAMGERAARRYGLPLTVIDGVGHAPMLEAPLATARVLDELIALVDGGR